MLGKLFKHEFKSTTATMLVMFVILVFSTILGAVSFSQLTKSNQDSTLFMVIWISLFVVYFIAIIAVNVVSFLYLCARYFKTMYSDQGYLTHTLPVSSTSIFNVKVLTSCIWFLATTVLSMVSFFLIIWISFGGEISSFLAKVNWAEVNEEISYAFGPGTTVTSLIVLTIVSSFISLFYSFIFIFLSMGIGQLFGPHKIGAAILAGIIIYFSISTISFFTSMPTLLMLDVSESAGAEGFHVLTNSYINLALSFVLTIVMYIACLIINKKHLNLD